MEIRASKVYAPAGSDASVTAVRAGATSAVRVPSPSAASGTAVIFPRFGGMLIGGPHNYDSTTYQAQVAKLDIVITALYEGWNKSGKTPAQVVNELKVRNPNMLIGNYTLMTEIPSSGAKPRQRTKLNSEVGPNGIGDWWAYNAAGQHLDWSGGQFGSWDTNVTLLTTPDSNGDRWPQWIAKDDNVQLVSNANYDIWYSDNCFIESRSTADWDRNGTNDSPSSTTARGWWRAGQRAYYNTAKILQPGKWLMLNADYSIVSVPEYNNVAHGGYYEHFLGKSWSVETWGGWTTMINYYHQFFDHVLDPKLAIFDIYMGDNVNDFQSLRYAFAACLLNDGYFSASSNYNTVLWYDEFDLAGASNTKWLGAAIDPPQTSAFSLGVYRRRFENGMAIVNPKGNGARTVTIGSGYHRISGSQAPTVNNGQTVTSTVTLADRDGLILVKN